jgi:hypothetical protein
MTRRISWPAATSARSDGTANSAVPAKTIFRKAI